MSEKQLSADQGAMPDDVRERCRTLRIKSKAGGVPTFEELTFLQDCFRQWPDEYKRIGLEAFEITKPFGSRI